jgi:hypothetical protein
VEVDTSHPTLDPGTSRSGCAPLGPPERVTAAQVWSRAGRTLSLGGRRLDDPEATLVRGLAAAARLFPPLDRALDERAPSRLELAPQEAALLLGEARDALSAAGVVVAVPGELIDASTRRLRLRARIGATGPSALRSGVEDGLSAASLTDLRYEVALGEDTLTEEEFTRIVGLKAPLVRWRGRWVHVDHSDAAGSRRWRVARPRWSSPRPWRPRCRASSTSVTSVRWRPWRTAPRGTARAAP